MRLAAGLRPDPLGELERSPRPPSRNWGGVPTSKGRGKGRGEGKGKGGREEGREGGEGRGGKGGKGKDDLRPTLFLSPDNASAANAAILHVRVL